MCHRGCISFLPGVSIPMFGVKPSLIKKHRPSEGDRLEPTPDEILEKFWEIYPRCTAKMLQEVKTGMIVAFKELGEYAAGSYQEFVDQPEEFLAGKYGKKKIKVNFYDGDNFVCTINFKVFRVGEP